MIQNLKAEYPFILREFTQDSLPHKAVLEFGRKETGKKKGIHLSFESCGLLNFVLGSLRP